METMLARLLFFVMFFPFVCSGQSSFYEQRKEKQIAGSSPFQAEIDGKLPQRVYFEDSLILVLNGSASTSQLPVHLLIIPRKRIISLNEAKGGDSLLVAHMVFTAKRIARELGIAESGYRLVINTNEDAGQSAFHLHMHLLGGEKAGAMVDQAWRNIQRARRAETEPAYATVATLDTSLRHLLGTWYNYEVRDTVETITTVVCEPVLQYQFIRVTEKVEQRNANGAVVSSYESMSLMRPNKQGRYNLQWSDSYGSSLDATAAAVKGGLMVTLKEAGKTRKMAYYFDNSSLVIYRIIGNKTVKTILQ